MIIGTNPEWCTPVILVTGIHKIANGPVIRVYTSSALCACSKGARRENWDIFIGSHQVLAIEYSRESSAVF